MSYTSRVDEPTWELMRTFEALAFLVCVLAATPAGALGDVTGTWQGTISCTNASTAGIDHTKSDVTIDLYDDFIGPLLGRFQGTPIRYQLVTFDSSPSKGALTGVSCAIAPEEGGYTVHLAVTAKEGSEKGTMKGTVISTSHPDNPGGSICKFRAKRVSTAVPSPTPTVCPP
jgi:hypothetical protein